MRISDQELLTECTRLREVEGSFILEIAIVEWEGPYGPVSGWKPFRTWKKRPTPDRLSRARQRALESSRFFGRCSLCGELNLAGHMHDRTVCQSCAERHLGIVY